MGKRFSVALLLLGMVVLAYAQDKVAPKRAVKEEAEKVTEIKLLSEVDWVGQKVFPRIDRQMVTNWYNDRRETVIPLPVEERRKTLDAMNMELGELVQLASIRWRVRYGGINEKPKGILFGVDLVPDRSDFETLTRLSSPRLQNPIAFLHENLIRTKDEKVLKQVSQLKPDAPFYIKVNVYLLVRSRIEETRKDGKIIEDKIIEKPDAKMLAMNWAIEIPKPDKAPKQENSQRKK